MVGAREEYEASVAEIERFRPAPGHVDGEPYELLYLRVEPRFGTVHSTDSGLESHFEHIP